MPDNILYDLVYAVISGFTGFFGVDASAHQHLFTLLSGREQADPRLTLALRIGLLAALIFSCWPRLRRLMRERSFVSRSHRLKRQPDLIAQLDLKLLRTAMLPALIGVLLYSKGSDWISGFLLLSLTFLINAVIIFIPRIVNAGNKDGRSVSPLDGLLLGFGSILGAFPGLSRMGCMLTAGAVGGLDRSYALDMSLLLSVPVLLGLMALDIVAVLAAKAAFDFVSFLLYLLYAGLAAFFGWLSIVLMRYLSQKIGYLSFAYYSLGLALFSFIFYLVI